MFEAHVLHLLRQYLGEYVQGLSAEALKISVWQGDVVLKDLQLKAEALNALKLPVVVKAGFLGSVRLKVPWNRLGKESVEVLLDRIFILAEPIQDEWGSKGIDKERLVEAKRRRLEEAEVARLEAKDKKKTKAESSPETSSWLGSLIATIIGNLKISITNVHIRYEDEISNPGKPFCAGVKLSRLAAVTTDENAKETFVPSGALDKLHKSLHLEHFAIYHDSNTSPWKVARSWQDMSPKEWSEVFEVGMSQQPPKDLSASNVTREPQYLLRPVDGLLRYYRHGKKEKRDPSVPFHNISIVLQEVTLTVSEGQYCDGLKLLEGISSYRKRIQFSHFRPDVSVLENRRRWWVYACQAGLQEQKKAGPHLPWERINHCCSLRRKYVQLYADYLLHKTDTDIVEIRRVEEEFDIKVLLLWRLLAHAKVESLKSKEATLEQENLKKRRWWGFGWKAASDNGPGSKVQESSHDQAGPGGLTKEEENKLYEFLHYQPGEESSLVPADEAPNMLQMSIDATIRKSSVRILDNQKTEILCGNFVALNVGIRMYPKALECHIKLLSYGLSAPEGSIIKSAIGEDNRQALTADYFKHPLDSKLDWKVAATILPCYVTIWFASFERLMHFFRSSHAVSPDVALETAAALQNKLEQVRRRAQEQWKLYLKEESRFCIDLDLDAPKVRIPADRKRTRGLDTQLLLDLGHFKLHTANEDVSYQDYEVQCVTDSLYSKCFISGDDIAAYLVDGSFDWSDMQYVISADLRQGGASNDRDIPTVYTVLDRCGTLVVFEKLRIPHPVYASTRISVQVPHLGLHFSPTRYHRVLQLIATFSGSNGSKETTHVAESIGVPWYPADQEGSMNVLVWKGLGNSVAEWQPCWGVLSGSYLYILESENAATYLRCCRMNGKQVLEVPSTHVGGSEYVVAVCNRGMELQKGLESSSTVIMQLKDEDCKVSWLKVLTSAVYKASAPVSSLSFSEDLLETVEGRDTKRADLLGQPSLLLTGALDKLQVSLYAGKEMKARGICKDTLILNLQAGGGKVNLLQGRYDLTVGVNLHYLKIEDKLQGSKAPSCQYIARSSLNKLYSGPADELLESVKPDSRIKDEDDVFNDALGDFGISPSSSPGSSSKFLHGAIRQVDEENSSSLEGVFSAFELEQFRVIQLSFMDNVFFESGGEFRNFVSMSFITRQFESPEYDGVDIQMNIHMATLEFFCNRPTVVALINFGTEISQIIEQEAESSTEQTAVMSSSSDFEQSPERAVVKGLLGRGKSRIVFQLNMNMDTVRIFLNQEDGSQLAMLDQETFQMDLRVFPGSFAISGVLGNLRVCDMTLGRDHHWGWICDIRNPGCGSLVELEFQSFNMDEDDYQGYDYSLDGKLSAVRIVFLYRFIQEIATYFSALATPQTQQFTRVVDRVGGIEKLVPQSDIDGAPAIKLNVSLETPIILMPRCSASKDFMQLDLGALKISNRFEWHGGSKDDSSAIHLDVLSAEISGINLIVGISGKEGESMIQEVCGLHLRVCRPLRDLFRRVPEVQVDVEVHTLRGILSDKEYLVISDCAATNFAESPNLPPDFRGLSMQQPFLVDNTISKISEVSSGSDNSSKQVGATWTLVRVTVEVQHAELELYNGIERESALARVELQGLWLNYRTTSTQEMDIFLTLPRLSVLDLRSDTKPEMRLMLGSIADMEDSTRSFQAHDGNHQTPQPPLLVMDVRTKPESQAFVFRIQHLRLLVVIDFLFAVGEFFVPSLAAMTGKDENMDIHSDPIVIQQDIRLTSPVYTQEEAMITLSSGKKLIADAPHVDEFIYDGCGKVLNLDIVDIQPVICIGPSKKLRFRNIKIKNGFMLKDCIQLQCGSRYSVSAEDGVLLYGLNADSDSVSCDRATSDLYSTSNTSGDGTLAKTASHSAINFILDVQAISPELTFYDGDKLLYASFHRHEKLLRAKMDFNLMYACKETDKWVRANVKRFSIDGGSGVTVVEPVFISMEYACVQGKTNLSAFTSDVSVQLSFSVMRLLLRLHNELVSKFQFGGAHVLSRCSHFDRIWVDNKGNNSGQKIAFWRPRAPPGYAILGHCMTTGEAPPSQAVMAISNTYRRVKKPTGFELVWILQDPHRNENNATTEESECSLWKPLPPAGYAALGFVAKTGHTPPAFGSVHCVQMDLVTTASVNDCVYYLPPHSGLSRTGFSIWRIENLSGSFFAHQSTESPKSSELYDLRDNIMGRTSSENRLDMLNSVDQSKGTVVRGMEQRQSMSGLETIAITPRAGQYIATTPQFERMWWDKGNDPRRTIAIWRPVPPPGFAIVGDCMTEGLEPPNLGVLLRDDGSDRLANPVRFVQCMHSPGKGLEDLFVWYPLAPAGYVSLGCVVSKAEETRSLGLFRCVRADLVNEVNISRKPVWSFSGSKGGYSCSLWKVENQAHTFLGRPDLKRPPSRLGYGLVETVQNRLEDNLSAEIKLPRLSVSIFDDLRGLMTPLIDVTITTMNLAANGRREALNAVCIASMAASTFNAHLEAWEPLIEPFEGIFKYESHDSQSGNSFKVGKRIRITTANIFNMNVTSANVDALMDAYLSWRKQSELEQNAFISRELEADAISLPPHSPISSALEENDMERLVLENNLGCEVYIRLFEDEYKSCRPLKSGSSAQVSIPPPDFGEKITTSRLRIPTQHVAIYVSEARDLPMNDDGNGHEYFYSLRIASGNMQVTDGQKVPVQSARSRCARPSTPEDVKGAKAALVKWNEVFIFDLPLQGSASMDVRVSNQAAKAGKGELIGMLSVPLKAGNEQSGAASSYWNLLQQSTSQMHQNSWPLVQNKVYSLEPSRRQVQSHPDEGTRFNFGSLVISIFIFTEKGKRYAENERDNSDSRLNDTGVFLGLSPDGPWSCIRSTLSVGTIPVQIMDRHMALDVTMNEGQKHAILRSLVMVSNCTDISLEVCVCPMSLLSSSDEYVPHTADEPVTGVEEIFENQRYQPLAGWGSKWPGHLLPNDPGRWSSRDYRKTSQSREDLEAPLPPGWIWSSDWVVDKAGYVDDDGWAYGADFQSLRWPPNSLKSCKKSPFDFIRRRRWFRMRHRIPEYNQDHSRKVISCLQPRCNLLIPAVYTSAQTDYCLQVRPLSDSTSTRLLWGRVIRSSNQTNRGLSKNDGESSSKSNRGLSRNDSEASTKDFSSVSKDLFMLSQLQRTEELIMCPPSHPSASKTSWWLSLEADANILYTEMNSPVYDWRIAVSAPLKIENLLPCAAEYTIWERLREMNLVQRDRGVVSAGGTVHLFSVDLRRQVYLTWLIQGGWKLEKEAVLISDPSMEELPSAFSLVNLQNRRRLQISLERDFGSTNTSARTLRIFVPYWLCNKAGLPLSYCLVEVEPAKGSDTDTPWLMRAVKAAKHASSRPSHTSQSKTSRLKKVVQRLEALESTGTSPTMLSPQAHHSKAGFIPFSPRTDDGLLSPRLGISVAASQSNAFKDGISFRDLEDNERVIVKALDTSGAYYKLSVFLSMSSERTKVVNFQPHTLFVNRLGCPLYLRQADLDHADLLNPNDPPKVFFWQSAVEPEVIKVCMDGYNWSSSFTVNIEGTSHVIMLSEDQSKVLLIRAEIRNGTTESRFLVIFRPICFTSRYRIENHSLALPIRFRQSGGCDTWQLLKPGSAVPFAWEDLQKDHQLEINVDGADASKSRKYRIDETADYQPTATDGTPVTALGVKCQREGSTQVVKVVDWMPSNKELAIVAAGDFSKPKAQELLFLHDTKAQNFQTRDTEEQVYLSLELAEFGISVVDHTPEELLYVSMQNFTFSFATGLGSGISRFKLRVDSLQVDNQLPLTPMPVLFRPQVSGNPLDFIFKCTITSQNNGSSEQYVYPYIGIQGPSTVNTVFLINIHEPIIWRLHQMFQHLNLGRLTSSQTTDVAVDPIIYLGLVNTSEIRFKVSLAMAPSQRPRGALGFWASLMTALGNTDDMQVRIATRVHEDVCMRQSALLAACISGLQKDILSHPLLLLSGMDILGNASSALGHMSKGVAALSMDKKFIKSRQKQDTKAAVEGFGDGFREGAEAFGKGLFRGVTGILTKPLEGARSSGMEGFVQGVGKGIIGVAAQPVSGVLDLLSKTTEGANAMKMKIAAVITSEAALLRHRLPRVIGADNILRPYDAYKAQGQTLLQLAEGGSIFGPMDIFKIRGKFAVSDAYEDHYNLPKGRTLIITHRRVILLQPPSSIIAQKKPDLQKDPCSVLWDVTWKDLKTMELMPGKHDIYDNLPSRLVLYLGNSPQDGHIFDSRESIRIVKCEPNTDQALKIFMAIQQAKSTYASDGSISGTLKYGTKRVREPYAGPIRESRTVGRLERPTSVVKMPPIANFSNLAESAG